MSDYDRIYKERTGYELDKTPRDSNVPIEPVFTLIFSSDGDGVNYSYKMTRDDITPIDDIIFGMIQALRDINEFADDPLNVQTLIDTMIYMVETGGDGEYE